MQYYEKLLVYAEMTNEKERKMRNDSDGVFGTYVRKRSCIG